MWRLSVEVDTCSSSAARVMLRYFAKTMNSLNSLMPSNAMRAALPLCARCLPPLQILQSAWYHAQRKGGIFARRSAEHVGFCNVRPS